MSNIDLDEEQTTAYLLVQLMWPDETPERRGLALAEEAGEVCRALLKRGHRDDSSGDRTTERDWDENIRTEVAQTMVVLMAIAESEGFSLRDVMLEELNALEARRIRMGRDWP